MKDIWKSKGGSKADNTTNYNVNNNSSSFTRILDSVINGKRLYSRFSCLGACNEIVAGKKEGKGIMQLHETFMKKYDISDQEKFVASCMAFNDPDVNDTEFQKSFEEYRKCQPSMGKMMKSVGGGIASGMGMMGKGMMGMMSSSGGASDKKKSGGMMGKMGGFMGRKSKKKETEPSSLMDAAAPSRGGMAGMMSGMKSMMGSMNQPPQQGNGMDDDGFGDDGFGDEE